jgi:hypothetical protein
MACISRSWFPNQSEAAGDEGISGYFIRAYSTLRAARRGVREDAPLRTSIAGVSQFWLFLVANSPFTFGDEAFRVIGISRD